ncbi:MAG: hypothetical protein ABSE71_00035 [Candidatus Micrarchaeaceae archaeon]|jgi:uncharacterized membrane protein|nr:hypothetical protein [Candidatus Micrarchaeota archaeon]
MPTAEAQKQNTRDTGAVVAELMASADMGHFYGKYPDRKKEYTDSIEKTVRSLSKEQLQEVTMRILERAVMSPQEKEERRQRIHKTLKTRAKERTK